MQLDDLSEDALTQILQRLSTDQRRSLAIVSKKWQRLITDSWVWLHLRVEGKNLLDSANKQIQWTLHTLHLQRLQVLQLDFKGFELSGISVDYLLGPLLELLEQGRFSELHSFTLAADMSLPDDLVSDTIQHLTLDVYALTTYIRCPQLQSLKLTTVSMPGPTFFSTEALETWQQLQTLDLQFRTCYLDDAPASWFLAEGLHILSSLQQAVIAFPVKLRVPVPQAEFCDALKHLEVSCRSLVLSFMAAASLSRLQNLLLVCNGMCVVEHDCPVAATDKLDYCQALDVVPCSTKVGSKVQCGRGPFAFAQ